MWRAWVFVALLGIGVAMYLYSKSLKGELQACRASLASAKIGKQMAIEGECAKARIKSVEESIDAKVVDTNGSIDFDGLF